MPELPEVETVRASLAGTIIGRFVRAVTVTRREVIVAPGDPEGGFSRQRSAGPKRPPVTLSPLMVLAGARLVEPRRHGKQLALCADDGRALVVHLGMTGAVLVRDDGAAPGTHEHVRWDLDDGRVMVFEDPRRFGGLWVVPDQHALERRWAQLGPDPLAIDLDGFKRQFRDRLRSRRTSIKAALLDQHTLAGVGNIYADESLFEAGIRPDREAGGLSGPRVGRLAEAIVSVLTAAVEARGSTLRDFRDATGEPGSYREAHRVYGRGGSPCIRCGRTLRFATLAQRRTVWCGICQR